ncbi:MAG: ParB/RepB/Spo0J family partition protein [Thermodesulfobacteriota bacterium]
MSPLGRGLGALLPGGVHGEESGNGPYFHCPIDSISPNPEQPRRTVDGEQLEELAQSIREKGILQPLVVRRTGNSGYQIIAGERRWRAARLANLREVPVIVREVIDDGDQLELALIENVQRQNLNPIEEAESYSRLSMEFGLTQEEIARKVGKDRSTVANAMRLLTLPHMIHEDIAAGTVTAGHARALLLLKDQDELLQGLRDEIVARGLNVRQAEQLAKQMKNGAAREKQPTAEGDKNGREADALPKSYCSSLSVNLQKYLGTKSRIVQSGGRGKIEIEYCSADDLERLLSLIVKGD